LDATYSAWPPGIECTIHSRSEDDHYVEELFPGLGWVILSLIGSAVLTLLGGVLVEIRELRRRRGGPDPSIARRAS
jgi:hypothetical protein